MIEGNGWIETEIKDDMKNNSASYIKEYIEEAESLKSLTVSKIRCDNDGEY